jgi:hypothetical protein
MGVAFENDIQSIFVALDGVIRRAPLGDLSSTSRLAKYDNCVKYGQRAPSHTMVKRVIISLMVGVA